MATNDARLVSVDARNGAVCEEFSDGDVPGQVNAGANKVLGWPGEYPILAAL